MHTLTTAMHSVWLDATTGCGWITGPATDGPMLDLADVEPVTLTDPDTGETLKARPVNAFDLASADWSALVRRLDEQGWEVHAHHDGERVGHLPNGRPLFLVYREPLNVASDLEDVMVLEREFVAQTGATLR